MINKTKRNDIYLKLIKKFDKNIAKDIEESIYIFSKKYADDHETPFLIENIYDTKAEELLCSFDNDNLMFIIKQIKNKNINPKNIAFIKQSDLNPKKFSEITNKKEIDRMRNENKSTTNAFECNKCKKNKCSVIEKQVRSADEPATLFITCLECGNVFTM